ncbi:MAG: ABC transporter permease [Tannerella sp.]|nr:ABC transporter permease [Tannerella sp.]
MQTLFRNFWAVLRRFRLATTLNVLGLSVAFAAFIILMIQVRYERTFDTSYPKTGRIYRVESTLVPAEANLSSRQVYTPFCARPLMETMLPAVPQVESYAIVYGASSEMYVNYETVTEERQGMMMPLRKVSEGFADVFSLEVTEGTAFSLAEPGMAFLPESLAKKMFGKNACVGKQIIRQDGAFYTIGGVYRDFPENTGVVNDVKVSLGDGYKNDWTDWALQHFVVLAPEASSADAAEQLTRFFNQTGIGAQMGYSEDIFFRLNAVENIYYSHDTSLDVAPKGNRLTTDILLSISLLVVIIAIINFLNFSTALTPARIKSINIRKVLGEPVLLLRFALVFEALIVCVISFLLALIWVYLFDLAGFSSRLLASVGFASNMKVVSGTFLLAVLTGLAAGIYPAFYMTSFRPAVTLKGSFGMSRSGRKLRVWLTGFQFAVSSGLIVAALFIWLQNRYLHTMGGILNDERIATVSLDHNIMTRHSDVLLERLKTCSFVEDVAFSEWPVGFLDYYQYTYTQSPENEDVRYYYIPVSYNFTDLMRLEIVGGRGFEKGDMAVPEERLILNELAATEFKIKPGDRLANGGLVVGIVKDFNFMNLRKKIEPMALTTRFMQSAILQPTIYVRTGGNALRAMEQIRSAIAEIDPLYPVDVRFYDRQFEQAYQKELKTSFQITLFSLLAVIISLMGVLGLVTFEAQYRRKEISLRKVMGATVFDVLMMFNVRFVRIVMAGFLPAVPLVWLAIERWLQSFAYRTPIHWWVFVLSLLIVLLITVLTVTLQCWRVALTNPVHSLKDE